MALMEENLIERKRMSAAGIKQIVRKGISAVSPKCAMHVIPYTNHRPNITRPCSHAK